MNSYTSRQRLLRPSCLPFHHLGEYIRIYLFLSCTPLECRPASRRLVLGGMAQMYRPLHGLAFSHIYHSTTWAYLIWCSRWDLNPHVRRTYASETYVSTIPPPEQIPESIEKRGGKSNYSSNYLYFRSKRKSIYYIIDNLILVLFSLL